MKEISSSGLGLARRALPLVLVCFLIAVVAVLLYYLSDVVLLAFAGALVALMLRTPADWLAERTPLSPTWALALVIVAVIGALGAAGWFFGESVADQAGTLFQRLPELADQLRGKLTRFDSLAGSLDPQKWLHSQTMVGRGIDVAQATFGGLANIAIVLFSAFFFALQPQVYVRGLLRLFPGAHRERASQVLGSIAGTLRGWIIGQLVLMTIVAAIVAIGLWLLGVPLFLALALLAGLVEFIPYLGPVLFAIPAVLVAFGQSTQLAAYVVLFYLALQVVEGNVLQPIVQRKAVYLPPALILFAQVAFGILFGMLGIMLATPIAAVALVLVQKLYIEDVLGERASK